MGLRVGIVFLDDPLVHRQGLIEFTDPAEMVAPIEGSSPLLIVDPGQGHGAAAKFADTEGFVGSEGNISAAYFAFDDRHKAPSFLKVISSYSACTGGCVQQEGQMPSGTAAP